MREQAVNADLFQLILDQKLASLLSGMTIDGIREYVDKLSSPEFGKSGHFSFYCEHCGGVWNFENKNEKEFFTKFHKYTGCAFENSDYEKRTEDSNKVLARSDKNISERGLSQIARMYTYNNNGVKDESTQETMPTELKTA